MDWKEVTAFARRPAGSFDHYLQVHLLKKITSVKPIKFINLINEMSVGL